MKPVRAALRSSGGIGDPLRSGTAGKEIEPGKDDAAAENLPHPRVLPQEQGPPDNGAEGFTEDTDGNRGRRHIADDPVEDGMAADGADEGKGEEEEPLLRRIGGERQ